MRRQRRVSRLPDRRNKVGLIAVVTGLVLAGLSAAISTPVHAATTGGTAAQPVSWTTWAEAGSSIIKVIQMVALVFGAYQFWAQRKERLAADATNDAQAQKDANYQAWQVVNAAQGKGGSGGRIDALADLARHRASARRQRYPRESFASPNSVSERYVARLSR